MITITISIIIIIFIILFIVCVASHAVAVHDALGAGAHPLDGSSMHDREAPQHREAWG